MQSLKSTLYVFWPEINRMMFGGLSDGVISGIKRDALRWDGSKWRVTLWWGESRDRAKLTTEVSGRWDEQLERGFVESEKITSNTVRPDSVGSGAVYKDWRFVPEIQRWVAGRTEEHAADGRLERVIAFEGASAGERGDFALVTALPDAEAADPIRGDTTFLQLVDFRRGIAKDRSAPSDPLGSAAPLPGGRNGFEHVWRRWLAWVVVAILVSSLVALRIFRKT
jgi:hypothetical protein